MAEKIFTVNRQDAKTILHTYGYWYYYDRGYHEVHLYIQLKRNGHIDWFGCSSDYNEHNSYLTLHKNKFKIEHHSQESVDGAYLAFMREIDRDMSEAEPLYLLTELDDYLNTNSLTTIAHGSVLHKKIKQCLKNNK